MIFLLDVNLLIALADEKHAHHDRAKAWFGTDVLDGWATCPITENGLIRILSNSAYNHSMHHCAEAEAVLSSLRFRGHHHFWADDISLTNHAIFDLRGLSSKDSTDTYLLGLARSKGGKLATFDRRLSTQAVIGGAEALHVIPT
ncbi:PIN domain-containing protein [Rhizobium sp. DKSPLA3]|uniref:Ribonuclease VapC n=1 Tax=Rhizobium quercicola TaxID=2901226 RepID=A0A9X1T0T7_9HYPH|nr:TA system VapC family ribonuclease toxin [Rhizobium quercicola]MCD7109827.1 PIN domain-containing protein [Rhizobium quercicola]